MPKPDADDQHDPGSSKNPEQHDREDKDLGDTDEEQLDETLDESFPASDPPANY